jgi:acyl-CoA thioester hydrolase
MATEQFKMLINVKPDDIDMQGHVNNIVYLRWVQDAAFTHWSNIAPKNEQERLHWVVRRHEIDYKKPAMEGDTLLVQIWIGETSRFTFDIHTEIVCTSNSRLLALARTIWCPIDRKTCRPTDISPDILPLFLSA